MGFKETVESKQYATLLKSYCVIIKQLNEMLPLGNEINIDDAFEKF